MSLCSPMKVCEVYRSTLLPIVLNLTLPLVPCHQARYRMNPNYAKAVKEDLEKLLKAGFIEPVDQATWLSPIVVVPK